MRVEARLLEGRHFLAGGALRLQQVFEADVALLGDDVQAVVRDQVLDYAHAAILAVVLQGARPLDLRHHALLEVLRAPLEVLEFLDEHQGPRELVLRCEGFNWRQ